MLHPGNFVNLMPMTAPSTAIVQKLWNYCNILRDDGLSYGDYTEQLTFLLSLKMAHERTQAPGHRPMVGQLLIAIAAIKSSAASL